MLLLSGICRIISTLVVIFLAISAALIGNAFYWTATRIGECYDSFLGIMALLIMALFGAYGLWVVWHAVSFFYHNRFERNSFLLSVLCVELVALLAAGIGRWKRGRAPLK